MIIFGWGKQLIKIIGPVFKHHCPNCGNEDYWILKRISTWFTLFFIPVIPYEWKYFLMCPVCERGLYLKSDQYNELKLIAELNNQLVKGVITNDQYIKKISELQQVEATVGNSIDSTGQVEAIASPKNDSKFCAQCGTELNKESKYCKNCGSQV